jgi:hypothetical protein
MNIACNLNGKYVSIELPGVGKVLTLCEVEVFGISGSSQSASLTAGA